MMAVSANSGRQKDTHMKPFTSYRDAQAFYFALPPAQRSALFNPRQLSLLYAQDSGIVRRLSLADGHNVVTEAPIGSYIAPLQVIQRHIEATR